MNRPLITALAASLIATLSCLPARAQQTPEDLVGWIYLSLQQPGPPGAKGLAWLSAPAQRNQFFSRRMVDFFDANDSHGDDLAEACVDFAFDIPGNDFDEREIARTLSVTSGGDAAHQRVIARFTNFGTPASITYDFVPEDGVWRIDDITGPGWQVSRIPCTAARAAPAPSANGYCFRTENDTLRLEVGEDGIGLFEFDSWQGGGHSCSGGGVARPVEGGWLYQEDFYGQTCRLGIEPTPDGGIRLSDVGWGCKAALCGARAAIDGLTYPRASQIDCSQMPPE
ncbi:hypothetical protein [Tropicimonas sp. IMCC34043]|uniref:hypothetical protein n=1 Tax=Tropicimonas sp. IMCC34043 TaxID=2248760 RepID=UPI000E25C4EC|nr:hypothetical protein [Tropicimonas sp. IMCC34043]